MRQLFYYESDRSSLQNTTVLLQNATICNSTVSIQKNVCNTCSSDNNAATTPAKQTLKVQSYALLGIYLSFLNDKRYRSMTNPEKWEYFLTFVYLVKLLNNCLAT